MSKDLQKWRSVHHLKKKRERLLTITAPLETLEFKQHKHLFKNGEETMENNLQRIISKDKKKEDRRTKERENS